MTAAPRVERIGRWPAPGEPGRFVARCSCRRWQAIGTAGEIEAAGRSHDDSPFRRHIVSIYGRVSDGHRPAPAASAPS